MAKNTAKKKKTRSKAKSLAKKNNKSNVEQRQLTEQERIRLDNYNHQAKNRPVKFQIKEGGSGIKDISLKDPDDPLREVKFAEALGTPDTALQGHLLDQVIRTFMGTMSTDGEDFKKITVAASNTMAMLSGIQPQDEIEGMLAVQMIGVHNMAMRSLGWAMLSEQTLEGKKGNISSATKMLRTFMAQVEALKKYRTGGQQKMIVEHVHVNQGGQAIVGTVNQGGGRNNKNHE